jgi:phenylalanyl-tRNA synthetase beta chain
MLTSARWLLSLLDLPAANLPTFEEAEHHLINAGFPIESKTALPGGDLQLDVEITSNRGDCISHLGLARELAARLGAKVRLDHATSPSTSDAGAATTSITPATLDVRVPTLCPRFTLRAVKGVKVGPSPAWLRERLESVGQRSINNVVDATNYLSLELGNPCHAFDAAKIAGHTLIVRHALPGEKLSTLDGKLRTLAPDDVVVADAQRAQSLAGVIGGAESQVTDSTTDLLLEVATWDPNTVRRTARRHVIRTDASHRFERLVDARTLDAAADRLAALVQLVAGGHVQPGLTASGTAPPLTQVRVRPGRVNQIMGVELTPGDIAYVLNALSITAGPLGRAADVLLCTVPAHRPDLTREIDLIEEIARVRGLDTIPLHDTVPVHVRGPQLEEAALREMATILAAHGFFETTTFSFASESASGAFVTGALEPIKVDQARAADPTLRTSVLTGLLASRSANQNARVTSPGGIRLFEIANAFAQPRGVVPGQNTQTETRTLALLLDVPGEGKKRSIADKQLGIRLGRGALEALARALVGQDQATAALDITPAAPDAAGFEPGAFGHVMLRGTRIGRIGLLSAALQREFELEIPVVGVEVELAPFLSAYPPKATIASLPAFPAIERDASLIVSEATTWSAIAGQINAAKTPRLEHVDFITTFRGGQIGKGKKSVTVRMRFRDAARTLTHEEVDAPVNALMQTLQETLGATLRTV